MKLSKESKTRKPNKIKFDSRVKKLYLSLKRTFLTGVATLVPLGLTFLILRFIYFFTVGRITPIVYRWFPDYPHYLIAPISLLFLLIFLYLIGLFSGMFIIRQMLNILEFILQKIPLIKTVYNATKRMTVNIIEQFAKSKDKTIVIVPFPHEQIYTMGLLIDKVNLPDGKIYYKVFIPTTPNVSIGILQFYPPEKIYECPITIEQAIEIVISSGSALPPHLEVRPLLR